LDVLYITSDTSLPSNVIMAIICRAVPHRFRRLSRDIGLRTVAFTTAFRATASTAQRSQYRQHHGSACRQRPESGTYS